MLAARFNRPGHEVVDHFTFVIASDGDIEEGICGEARSLAGHLGLGRLIVVLRQQPHLDRGRHLARVQRGRRQALRGLRLARAEHRRGHLARAARGGAARRDGRRGQADADRRAHAHRARAARNKQDTAGAHGWPLGEEEVKLTSRRWAGRRRSRSTCPRRRSRTSAAASSAARSSKPSGRSASRPIAQEHPELAREFERMIRRELPAGLGRRGAPVPRLRYDDGDPQVVARGAPVGGRQGAGAGRRLGRPRAVDAHADRRRRQRRSRAPTRAATSTSASASTRWARSSTA